MATMIYISPSDRKTYISLGEDKENARKIFDERCKELIEMRWDEERMSVNQPSKNELRIKWLNDYEWLYERLYFDEDNNSIYA